MARYYDIDGGTGRVIGSYARSQIDLPGLVLIATPPPSEHHRWSGSDWTLDATAKATADAEAARVAAIKTDAQADAMMTKLQNATPAQVRTWLASHAPSLQADAIEVLAQMLILMARKETP